MMKMERISSPVEEHNLKKKEDKHSQGMDSLPEIILNDNSNIRRI